MSNEQLLAKLLTKALVYRGTLGQTSLAVPVSAIQRELEALASQKESQE